MKNSAAIISLVSLVGTLALPMSAGATSSILEKQKMSTYSASGVKFNYPASWGALTARSAEDSDGMKVFDDTYLKTMIPLSASNPVIKEVFFHKPTKILAYVESKGKNDVLSVIKPNSSAVKLSSVGNDIDTIETYSKFGELNISPRGHLLFVVESPYINGGPVGIYDLRTFKEAALAADMGGWVSGTFFSKDDSRMAITAIDPDEDGENLLYIQDPKTLRMKEIYRIHVDEFYNAREKYGDDATVEFRDIKFNGNSSVSFTKVVSKDMEGKKLAEIEKSTYNFFGKGKLTTKKNQMVK